MQRIRLRAATIHRVLAHRCISQNGLADAVGISRPHLSQMLSGQKCAGPKARRRLLDATDLEGLEFDDLFEIEVAA